MRKAALFLIISLINILIPASAYAHQLKTDHAIGAVMHINPDDDPIAGKESSFFFEFKDTQNKFTPAECFCTFSVLHDGNTIVTHELFPSGSSLQSSNAGTVYTFPEKGVYVVRVAGTPRTSGAFQAFQLDYPIRVARSVNTSDNQQPDLLNNWWIRHIPHILILLVIIAFLIKAGLQERKAPANDDE